MMGYWNSLVAFEWAIALLTQGAGPNYDDSLKDTTENDEDWDFDGTANKNSAQNFGFMRQI